MLQLQSFWRIFVAACLCLLLLANPAVAQDDAPADPPADVPADGGDGSADTPGDGAENDGSAIEGEGDGTDVDPPTDGDGSGDDVGGDPEAPPAPPPCPPGLINAAGPSEPVRCEDPEEIARLLGEYEAAAAEETEALIELAAILETLDELNEQLDGIRTELGNTQIQEAAALADAGYAALRSEATGALLGEVEVDLAAEEDRLRQQAVAAYVGGGEIDANVTNALLDADSLSDASIAREYSSAVMGDQLLTLDNVNALRDAVDDLTVAVAEVEALAQSETARVEVIKERVSALLDAQNVLVEAAEAEATEVAGLIGEIQSKKQAFADELQISASGGGQIGTLLRQVQGGQTPPDVSTGIFGMPVVPTEFGSGFGPRFHPIFHVSRMHTGIDFSGDSGQPILSSADGMVVVSEEVGGYGNVVVVEHGNGLATLYAHMTAFSVSTGTVVERGEMIGFVGSTGFSTGPHLHYEVRLFGMPVDPMPYLDLVEFVEIEAEDDEHEHDDGTNIADVGNEPDDGSGFGN